MIEIWVEYFTPKTTSQKFADQVRTIIKKCWFSDHEIIEIQQKINDQQGNNILPDTRNINEQKQHNWNERPTSENENPTQPNTAQPNNPKQTLSPEQKLNLENLKIILNSENTTLPSLRNIEWRTVKAETNKVNQVLT